MKQETEQERLARLDKMVSSIRYRGGRNAGRASALRRYQKDLDDKALADKQKDAK